ncbi:Mini-ribonuclease 3 [Candidatus Stoquefichus sp. SB1]|jgi:ribonuclease-3 family protein|uniref:Mini-ribonuclease 3 n=1 Tax=Candidatus Stoquefichus sp. SB1 TaxID=1658109 RepID=UPI00067F70ED|nr:ribonuclease III domain-containing protein [Candidatus Stoquefichus sp. SB1]
MRPELINPLALAYLGDAIFEVYVREYLIVEKEITKPDLLQKEAIAFVSAVAQAGFMKEAIENEWVSEEEIRIYKRGRNAKSRRVMKNTSVITHNQSSGFEALIGHLHLLKDEKRILELFELYKDYVMRNS